jgi:hypothetical protein
MSRCAHPGQAGHRSDRGIDRDRGDRARDTGRGAAEEEWHPRAVIAKTTAHALAVNSSSLVNDSENLSAVANFHVECL